MASILFYFNYLSTATKKETFYLAPDLFTAAYWGLAIKKNSSLRMYKVALAAQPSGEWCVLSHLSFHMNKSISTAAYENANVSYWLLCICWMIFFPSKDVSLIKMPSKFRKHVTPLFSFFLSSSSYSFHTSRWNIHFSELCQGDGYDIEILSYCQFIILGYFLRLLPRKGHGPI